jgi:4-hydroxy 2-oxovalerate aldolase
MKILDVTLRDGGFVNDFNWEMSAARKHISVMNNIGVHILELGYWKQTSKSQNPFYNLNEDVMEQLEVSINDNVQYCTIVDFHYCSKNPSDYPKSGDTAMRMVRITSRKEDFFDAVEFAKILKKENGLKVSFQIINSTNYSAQEMLKVCQVLIEANVDIVGFADSHGNLNLYKDFKIYHESINLLNDAAIDWGFHLHNHTGRAVSNYWYLLEHTECKIMDASVNGIGKGLGNLRLEDIIRNEDLPKLLKYMAIDAVKEMSIDIRSAYNRLTGRWNVTDNYTKLAMLKNIDIEDFPLLLRQIENSDKDSYNPNILDLI